MKNGPVGRDGSKACSSGAETQQHSPFHAERPFDLTKDANMAAVRLLQC